jgi:hypothetical protein
MQGNPRHPPNQSAIDASDARVNVEQYSPVGLTWACNVWRVPKGRWHIQFRRLGGGDSGFAGRLRRLPMHSGSAKTKTVQQASFRHGAAVTGRVSIARSEPPPSTRERAAIDQRMLPIERVDACVEAICRKGCRAVRDAIELLDRGCVVTETANLSKQEVGRVLEEIKAIMAVYERPCSM